jgi:ribosomal protein S18 acetylase RimI-like enzyme
MLSIATLNAEEATAALPQLAEVLKDAVDNGASVSFLPPLAREDAAHFWQKVVKGIAQERQALLVARLNGEVVGTVILALSLTPNGLHRAEVQKLLVHTKARRQGIAEKLMKEIEGVAKAKGRTLLYLDTCKGHQAENLYRKLGWTEVGIIPNFAKVPGGYCDTVFFYKLLPEVR